MIISADGYVLTNHHVIEDAERIRVTLPDQRRFEGTVVGSDPDSDLAIVKINGQGLPTARLGDSSRLRKGEWVVAIGNPLGFESAVTVGVVSAARRGTFTVEGKRLHSVIQTDAAINQGNSGGALVNLMDGWWESIPPLSPRRSPGAASASASRSRSMTRVPSSPNSCTAAG